jgi:MtN3 and saliva related transmembrane protein
MSLEVTQLLGTTATLYGVGGALSVLLQARQMYARGSSGDVSVRFLAVYVGGFATWLLYGLSIGDIPIILVHAVGLLCGTITLTVALMLRGSQQRAGRLNHPLRPGRGGGHSLRPRPAHRSGRHRKRIGGVCKEGSGSA